jgi:hypothetical protein
MDLAAAYAFPFGGNLLPPRDHLDPKERIKMRTLTLAIGLTLFALATPASAYTQEERMACENDAFRVCGHAIPDEQRVKSCMLANVKKLSPQCRRVFRQPPRRRR